MIEALKALMTSSVKSNIVKNAIGVSLVVGTLLNAVNYGSIWFNGQEIPAVKVAMNFMIPYCVATYSAAKNEIGRIKT